MTGPSSLQNESRGGSGSLRHLGPRWVSFQPALTSRTGFLRGLADRGLRGVKLVVADDHRGLPQGAATGGCHRGLPQGAATGGCHRGLPQGAATGGCHRGLPQGAATGGCHRGLRAAAGRVFSATHQRCRVHWAEGRAVPCRRQAPRGSLRHAQDDPRPRQNKAAAVEQWGEIADALRARHAKLGELMDASREDVLATMDFPREHWPQIASTGPRSRAPTRSSAIGREIKRRSDVVGIFPNDAAVVRLVGALMLEASDEWAVTRRTMSLEALARVLRHAQGRMTPSACPPRRPDRPAPLQGPALLHHPPGHYPTQITPGS